MTTRALPQGQRPPDVRCRAKRFRLFKRAVPDFPLSIDELDAICQGCGVALCCPILGPKYVEMIAAGGGPLSIGAAVRRLNEAAPGWSFWYDCDYLGGSVLALPAERG